MIKHKSPFSIKYKFVRFLLLIVTLPFIKKIRGSQNFPKAGPFIIAANHCSIIDPVFLLVYMTRIIKRHTHFLAKTKYYRIPLFQSLIELAQSISVAPKEEARSLYIALEYLQHGEIVGIYPEATRSPDGKIKKGKAGVAALALNAKAPVIPVGLINTHKILPRGTFFPRLARCEINIGKPLSFDNYYKEYDEAVNQDDLAKIADIEEKIVKIIMQEIARLSNQEYPF